MSRITLTLDVARTLEAERLQTLSRSAMTAWMNATSPEESQFWFASMESYARRARLALNPVTVR